ncbi:MAG: hypothetical protein ABI183_04280 [Polyangiaceae bacterium]
MKAHFFIAAAVAAPLFFVRGARADQPAVVVENDQPAQTAPTPTPPPPPPAEYQRTTKGTPGAYSDPDNDESDGPRARTGFQMSLRTGYALPMGSSVGGQKMSQDFGGQVPFLIDIGGKIHPNIFIGGNLGLNVGGCGDLVANDCATVSLRIGAEIIFSILPRNRVNPWVGYGIGLEASGISVNNGTQSISLFGPEYGHFLGGVDFRVNRVFGIGPFLDYGIGEYTSASVTANGITQDGTFTTGKTLHEWLTLGAKFTFFP